MPDFTRYASNIYHQHLTTFRDTWLERSMRSHIGVTDLHAAYDEFCERNAIVHRKIRAYELLPELSRIGVRLANVSVKRVARTGRVYRDRRPAFVTWRLTRNAKHAIRNRTCEVFDYNYIPIGKLFKEKDE